jgi:hypothetical protein
MVVIESLVLLMKAVFAGNELIVFICFGNSWHARETYQLAKDVAAFPPSASILHQLIGRLWQL